ncbi:hypothetical protein ASR50_34430 [Streptomyces sp. 4F]|nr:hypothetical protein ASR50_01010 [Streptomyces sp. 4F]ALV54007.1 hypothetical protein ASR50_34430 [Streptomyces sp. 4F]
MLAGPFDVAVLAARLCGVQLAAFFFGESSPVEEVRVSNPAFVGIVGVRCPRQLSTDDVQQLVADL